MPLTAPLVTDTFGSAVSIPLPVGTELGFTLILLGMASEFTVPDARFTWHFPHSSGTETGGFWIGMATTLDPVTVTFNEGTGARSANARLLSFRDRVLAGRINTVDAGSAQTHTVPVVPGGGSGAIALGIGWAGIGGLNAMAVTGADAWVNTNTNSSYEGAGHAWVTPIPLSGSTITVSWPNAVSPVTFASMLLLTGGGGYAPPCRNIKRGDVLDLGGARNYPPSKMTQTSSRGVGAY